mgnify:CR=1 FL=1
MCKSFLVILFDNNSAHIDNNKLNVVDAFFAETDIKVLVGGEFKTLNTKENYKLYVCILNIDQNKNLVPISPILPGEFKEETIFILKSLGN